MVAGKTEGTMKIERVGKTWIGDLLDQTGVLLRVIAPGFLGLYIWAAVAEEGGYNLTWLSAAGAGVSGFLIYALHTCFLSRLVFRPAIMLSILAAEKHSWISPDQRKLAEHGSRMLLLELASQRWRRRISDNPEIKAVQKGLDRRCRLGSFLYCSSYAVLFAAGLAFYPVDQAEEPRLAYCMIVLGGALLLLAILSGYATMQTDLWAAKTYPQGKTLKLKAPAAKASRPKVKTVPARASKPKATKRPPKSKKTRKKTS